MTNLKEIHGLNAFCGPGVMSALTGKSSDECASVIMAVTGKHEVRAVAVKDLIEAFKRLRFDMIEISRSGYSLFGNLNNLSSQPGMYIVTVPRHVVAVEVTEDTKIWLIDNHSKSALPAEGSARLSQKCEVVYKITERPQPVFVRTDIVISKYVSDIRITAHDKYDNGDNIVRSLGGFTFKSYEELVEIVSSLNDEVLLNLANGALR